MGINMNKYGNQTITSGNMMLKLIFAEQTPMFKQLDLWVIILRTQVCCPFIQIDELVWFLKLYVL